MVSLEPNDPLNWKKRGDKFLKNGEYQMAIKCYLNALRLDPNYIPAWNNLGYSFNKIGKKDAAARCKARIDEITSIKKNKQTHYQNIEQHDNLSSPKKTETSINNLHPSVDKAKTDRRERINLSEKNDATGKAHKQRTFFNFLKNYEDPGRVEHSENMWENYDEIKKVLVFSLIIGICLSFSMIILINQAERYTQFYLIPNSYSNFQDPYSNISSFSYGVKSFERDMTKYSLAVYVNSNLIEEKEFSLDPGEVREEKISFSYPVSASISPIQITAKLKSPYSVYDLHYWIVNQS